MRRKGEEWDRMLQAEQKVELTEGRKLCREVWRVQGQRFEETVECTGCDGGEGASEALPR